MFNSKKQMLKKFRDVCLYCTTLAASLESQAKIIEFSNIESETRFYLPSPQKNIAEELEGLNLIGYKSKLFRKSSEDDLQKDLNSPAQEEEKVSHLPSNAEDKSLNYEQKKESKIISSPSIEDSPKNFPHYSRDIENFSNRVRKDVKMRNRAVYSEYALLSGNFLATTIAPPLMALGGILVVVPDPTGTCQIIGLSAGGAGLASKGVGYIVKESGKKAKKHYCKKIGQEPVELKLKEERRLIKLEEKYIKSEKKSHRLENKIVKVQKKSGELEQEVNNIIQEKEFVDKKISNLREILSNEYKINK